MTTHPPRRVLEQAEQAHLGAPDRAFDPRLRALAWVAMLAAASGVLIVGGLAYQRAGRQVPGMVALGLAAAYCGGAGWILWRAVLRGRVVYLFERGFVLGYGPVGRGPESYTWDELISVTIAGLRSTRLGGTRWRLEAVAKDGRAVTLGGELPGVGEFGEIITAKITERVVPWYLQAVSAGGTVTFGPFQVGREGIVKDGELLPWPYVRDVVIDNGMICVHRIRAEAESWGVPGSDIALAATAGSVPNAVALTFLCRKVLALGEADPVDPAR